jgi:hypothetical protein
MDMDKDDTNTTQSDRRAFLQKCGRFAIVTPPAISMLLSTSLTSNAIAKSGGDSAKPGKGRGHSHSHRHSGRKLERFKTLPERMARRRGD